MTTATDIAALAEKMDWIVLAMNDAQSERKIMMKELSDQGETQRNLVRDVEAMKPAVDRIKRATDKAMGVALVLSILGAAAWTGILFFKEAILEFITK
jgi:hypothetical protein